MNARLKLTALCFSIALGLTCLIGGGQLPTANADSHLTSLAKAGGDAKNLKIYPKSIDKKALKNEMKIISKSLGVQCDFCHDMDGMHIDTPMKKKARSMMRMTKSINKTLKKDGFHHETTCMTCHNGNEEPKH